MNTLELNKSEAELVQTSLCESIDSYTELVKEGGKDPILDDLEWLANATQLIDKINDAIGAK